MNIYDYVFGVSCGQVQVQCCFHDDTCASAGISPSLQYNCFACGAHAGSDVGFIQNYFGVNTTRAKNIQQRLIDIDNYRPSKNPISVEQRTYLNQCGITDAIIDKHFFRQSNGKLMYEHSWNGSPIGYTWFNSPTLPEHNVGHPKYKYQGTIGGMCTPYDDVVRYDTLLITEGEKDMLTAKSYGIKSAVAKVGGAMTPIIGGINFNNKKVVIIYDCDARGREGAEADAIYLKEECGCSVKVIDLGLQDKEDLNDYFVKYGHTAQDLYKLIQSTPEFVIPQSKKLSKVEKFIQSLTKEELKELKEKIKNDE